MFYSLYILNPAPCCYTPINSMYTMSSRTIPLGAGRWCREFLRSLHGHSSLERWSV